MNTRTSHSYSLTIDSNASSGPQNDDDEEEADSVLGLKPKSSMDTNVLELSQ